MDSSPEPTEPVTQPVTLQAGSDELRPVFERLWQLYWHDLSEFRGALPRPDGTYRSDRLAPFFGAPDHHAHLIHHGRDLGGFALVRPSPEGATSVYAFFVVRPLRRKGVGHRAARELLRLHPGPWAIAFPGGEPEGRSLLAAVGHRRGGYGLAGGAPSGAAARPVAPPGRRLDPAGHEGRGAGPLNRGEHPGPGGEHRGRGFPRSTG